MFRLASIERLECRLLLSAGDLDFTFSSDGKMTTAFDLGGDEKDFLTAAAVQADGRIVLVGTVDLDGAGGFVDTDFAIVRLNPDGSLDTSFSGDGRATIGFDRGGTDRDQATDVAIQADGKIIVVGAAQKDSSNHDFAIARLNSNGSLDTTFSVDGKTTVAFDLGGPKGDYATGVAIQADGKIVVVGGADQNSGDADFVIARLNSNGSLDTSFNDGQGRTVVAFDIGGDDEDVANDVAIQADGKIVVVGRAQKDSTNYDFAIARLNTSGSEDITFSGDGKTTVAFNNILGGSVNEAAAVAIQSNGRIVVAGNVQTSSSGSYDWGVVRFTSGGSLDTTFSGDGKQTVFFNIGGNNTDIPRDIAIQSDGRIIVAGNAERNSTGNRDFAAARLTSSGSLDTTFSSDGKTTIAFDQGGGNSDSVTGLAIQSDGRIILAGSVQQNSTDDYDFGVVRLDGDLSATPDITDVNVRVLAETAQPFYFSVNYLSNVAIDASTLGSNDVSISFSYTSGGLTISGSGESANFVAVDSRVNGTERTVQYSVSPPGSVWSADFSGSYTGSIRRNSVKDINGRSIPADLLGTVSVTAILRMYRAYNPNADYHFFTTSRAEFDNAVAAGYRDEVTGQNGFAVSPKSATGNTAIYRLYNLQTGRHYYTASLAERDFLVSIVPPPTSGPDTRTTGWRYEKEEGFIYSTQTSGTTEIFRLYNNNSGVHLYTNDATYKDAVLAISGGQGKPNPWVQHSSIGFAFPVAAMIPSLPAIAAAISSETVAAASSSDVILNEQLALSSGLSSVIVVTGDDFLAGGHGRDRLVGSNGNDILVSDEFDASATRRQLAALLDSWTRTRKAVAEVDDLDAAFIEYNFDQLTGSAGADWFLIGTGDKITDLKKNNVDGDLVTQR